MGRQRVGYSLLEMTVTLGLISVLYAAAMPLMKNPGARTEPDRFTQALTGALAQARGLAIAGGERVTICGSLDGHSCERHWPGDVELLVFTDRDDSRTVGPGDVVHLQQRLRLRLY